MKILVVINNLYTSGNGLSASVKRTVSALREQGLEARVLAAGKSDSGETPEYHLQDDKIPFFSRIIDQQGYNFAKTDTKIISQAVQWAEIIHLEEPFTLQIAVCKAAKKYNKPCVATYHLHPENLFASVGFAKSRYFNQMTMLVWKKTVFDHCEIVQCPSENVRDRLQKAHFKAELRVISNGITAESCRPVSRRSDKSGRIHILSVGRFSKEKDQDTLLEAMKYTRNADKIQLHFAGKGPTGSHLKAKAGRLYKQGIIKYKPTFGFYHQEKLRNLFSIADLYVHSAVIEVEGMSCMEAICTGIVPIIAEGKLTATSQFARSERSLYPAGDPRALADRIDDWIEHPDERKTEAKRYLGIEKNYRFEETVTQTIQMYRDALAGK